jgi:predicted nucleic acid-binding protein
MRLVVDTNVLFSFFKRESVTRRLLTNFELLEPVTPSFCIEELNEHKELIRAKAKLADREFEEVLDDLLIFLKVFSLSEYRTFLSAAQRISPDPDDSELFALALKFSCPIWSNEKAFKNQSEVRIYTTAELRALVSLL